MRSRSLGVAFTALQRSWWAAATASFKSVSSGVIGGYVCHSPSARIMRRTAVSGMSNVPIRTDTPSVPRTGRRVNGRSRAWSVDSVTTAFSVFVRHGSCVVNPEWAHAA